MSTEANTHNSHAHETSSAPASKPNPTPASNATPFVSQFKVSTLPFSGTLSPHIGQKYPRYKFAPPSNGAKANIKTFLQTLTAYDNAPSADLEAKLNSLMSALHLSAIRLQEDPDHSVIFYPNDVQGHAPITCGGVLTWRFGQTAQFNVAGGIPQVFVFDPHSGQDGTIYMVTQQYLAGGAKALLSHAFNPNAADNPNFKGNPITPSNIRRFADPAHSNTTAFVPFVTELYNIYPHAGCTVTHGMSGKPNFQMVANNDRTAKFLQDGTRDWCALLSIALALQNMPTNPNIATIEASFPGYIVKKGVKVPLTSSSNTNSPIRLNAHVGDNTDCVGHMANHAQAPFSMGSYLDNAFFVEFGPHFRDAHSQIAPLFTAAQAMASQWYMAYDPAVQNPWQLAKNFPDVYNDMSLYPKLFDPAFVQAYKQHGTNPFNKGSSAAAVADFNAIIAATPTGAATDSAADLTDGVESDAAAIATTASSAMQKLIFSSSVTKATFAANSGAKNPLLLALKHKM